jgi:hypothetical protein
VTVLTGAGRRSQAFRERMSISALNAARATATAFLPNGCEYIKRLPVEQAGAFLCIKSLCSSCIYYLIDIDCVFTH